MSPLTNPGRFRMSLNVWYFRRIYGNFGVLPNLALTADDFDTVQVMVPNDPRLPNAGQMITLFDQKPESITIPDRIRTSADNWGGQSEIWHGIDITADARLEGFLFQGGVSTGSLSEDNCAQSVLLPENVTNTSSNFVRTPITYCDTSENWLTQVKFLTSYTLPYDVQIAATLQNQQGPERIANVTYPRALISDLLDRPSTIGNQTANVLEPGTAYGDRFTTFDLRLTKIFGLSDIRIRAMLDIFNLFNSNAVTREQTACGSVAGGPCAGTWISPQVIMAGRLAKVAFQLDF